jgi:hypothetical protein
MMTPDELREKVARRMFRHFDRVNEINQAAFLQDAQEVIALVAPAVLEMAAEECDSNGHAHYDNGRPVTAFAAHMQAESIRALAATWAKAEGKKS